jgi:hypothetical protein
MKSNLIDPKFDQIPADEVQLTEEERAAQLLQKPIPGLSIDQTIARSANLSIGSHGINTSTVPSGAGSEEPESDTPSVDPEA